MPTPSTRQPGPLALLRALTRLRGDFSAAAAAERIRLLRALERRQLRSASALAALHDELLFLSAFPCGRLLAAAAQRMLRSFAHRVGHLPARAARPLHASGIAGTLSTHTYMFGVARWLVRHGEVAVPHWQHDRDAERLEPLIRLSMLPAELDAFDDSGLSTRAWLELASARLPGGVLHWLVGPRAMGTDATWREWYDSADVPLSWSLGDSRWCTTRNVAPGPRRVSRGPFRRVPDDAVASISTPLATLRRLRAPEATAWVDASLAALTARCREVVPMAHANLDEVYVAELGEGVQLCVIGAGREDRLALEANYGYVMFSNRVPIGYGGVTPLGNQANTGVNIFESFRGSEASFVFAQTLRVFRALFGVDRFVVNPFQFGADNEEAIASGAYWFYDRLGFRPADVATRAIADRERRRLAARQGPHSTPTVLRALARSDVILELTPTSAVPLFRERWLADMGQLVAASLSGVPAAGRIGYVLDLARRQKLQLTGERAPLTAGERRGAVLLSPILQLLTTGIARWNPQERVDLWDLVRAKGALRERTFVRRARAHVRFWKALAQETGVSPQFQRGPTEA
ncbi:MAG: hypothetical protein H7066_10500 [Cytophagaceae bacterium]|nr:hypothetical protein [Gemmatimonadaceae bacterium]